MREGGVGCGVRVCGEGECGVGEEIGEDDVGRL